MHRRYRAFAACGLPALAMLLSACEIGTAASAVLAAIDQIREHRALTEQFVRDLKTHVPRDSQQYAEAERQYFAARTAYTGYAAAIELAVAADQTRADLTGVSNAAEGAARQFAVTAVQVLSPDADTRAFPVQRIINLPVELHRLIGKLPPQYRQDALRQLRAEIMWRSWDAI